MAIITKAIVKSFLRIPTAETGDDSLIDEMIGDLEAFAKTVCNRVFESAEVTQYYDGDGTKNLLVNYYPITAVSALYDDTDRVYGADTAIDSGDYIIKEDEGKIVLDEGLIFAEGVKNIKITYTGGYSAGTMPADLKHAIKLLVCAKYLEGQGEINAIKGDGYAVEDRTTRWRKEAMGILQLYKRFSL